MNTLAARKEERKKKKNMVDTIKNMNKIHTRIVKSVSGP